MGDLGAVRKPGQRIPRVYQDKQAQPGQTGRLPHESATRAGRPLMGTLLLMRTFISALLKATGVGNKNRREKRIWSREKSPAARANSRDGAVLGDKTQLSFPKGGRTGAMRREKGKEKYEK